MSSLPAPQMATCKGDRTPFAMAIEKKHHGKKTTDGKMTEESQFPFSTPSFGISERGPDLDFNHQRTSCCLQFDSTSQ